MDAAPRVWRWGVCGTGGIATDFVNALCGVKNAKLVAVGSRTAAGAERFGRAHGAYVYPARWLRAGSARSHRRLPRRRA